METVLIVDDSIFARRVLKQCISGIGYQTLEAEDGRKALQMVTSHQIECILLDLNLPELTGMEVLKHLHEQNNKIPVIVVSADIQDSTRNKCLELGCVHFETKPIKVENIERAVTTAMGPP